MSRDALQAALDAVAEAHDRAGWALAKLAYEWRAERIPNWAARIGSHPRLRKSPRTVQGWAQAYACWQTLQFDQAAMLLPFSAWEVWSRYLVTGDDPTDRNAKLVAVLEQWAAEPGGTIEGLAAFLAETFGDERHANGAHPLLRWPTTVAPRAGNFIVELDGESWAGVSEVTVKAKKG